VSLIEPTLLAAAGDHPGEATMLAPVLPALAPTRVEAGPRFRPIASRIEGDHEVVDAHDTRLTRPVTLYRTPVPVNALDAAGFLRGAYIAGALDHPGVSCVLAIGRDADGRAFYVTPRHRGTTFEAWCRAAAGSGAPRSLGRRLTAVAEISRIVAHAHRHGVVHGRLGAGCVEVGAGGEVRVGDWGAAVVRGEQLVLPLGVRDRGPESAGATESDDVAALLGLLALAIGDDRAVAPELAPGTSLGAPTAAGLARRILQFLDGERNLELRASVAARHVASARAALEAGPAADRARALREARAALALTPGDPTAAAIVARLMIEVPDPLPAAAQIALDRSDPRLMIEVPDPLPAAAQIALDRSDHEVIREMGSALIAAFAAFLLYVPLMVAQGIHDVGVVAGITVMASLMVAWAARWRAVGPRVFSWPAMLGAAAILTLYARTMGPFVNAPAQAALATMAVSFFPRGPAPAAVAATFAIPTVGTWLLEWLDVLATTTSVEAGALVVRSPVVDLAGPTTSAGLVFVTAVMVTMAGAMADHLARSQQRCTAQVVAQRWKIRRIAAPRG
jgi:hypothetical protein